MFLLTKSVQPTWSSQVGSQVVANNLPLVMNFAYRRGAFRHQAVDCIVSVSLWV